MKMVKRISRPLLNLFLVALSFPLLPQVRADLPEVADGFEIRLFAAVPAATFPCQVATGPDGSLFVAEDPMDQIGPHEADHGRIVRFGPGPDGKPSPDKPTTFADNLRAVFGMAWRDGSLYVMHMPYLSVFRDTDGDGRADQRKDLFTDLGPGPKSLNDHIVSGLQFGMDGWLYISTGDKGVPGATRPEDGKKVQIKGGGTLRCRPDGTGLEVISSGTRNHLEPNLDSRDNIFTYDNTDDGDGWWTRVTHHIDGGYYGYAYDYHNFRHRMLDRIAEYGGGSPCGGVVYKEAAWPSKYRDMAFWAEWGKREVRGIRFKPKGASFDLDELVVLAKPGKVDSFRPIDLALSYDGSTLYIADWSMGGWNNKTEKLGRIYAVSPKISEQEPARKTDKDSLADQILQLSHPAFGERMRAQNAIISKGYNKETVAAIQAALTSDKTTDLAKRHLIWALEGVAGGGPDSTMPIIEQLKNAPSADVRAQAARAMGLRQAAIAVDPLIESVKNEITPEVALQAIVALGRLGDESAIPVLVANLGSADPYIDFAARVALRRIGNFEKAAKIGLASTNPDIRRGTLIMLEQQYDSKAAQALSAFASDAKKPADERAMAVTYLATLHRKTKPWDGSWWGTRPTRGTIPAREVEWSGTSFVLDQLRSRLGDSDSAVKLAAISTVAETRDAKALEVLRSSLKIEKSLAMRLKVMEALAALKDTASVPAIATLVADSQAGPAALAALGRIGDQSAIDAIVKALNSKTLGESPKTIVAGLSALSTVDSKAALEPSIAEIAGLINSGNSGVRSAVVGLLANYPKDKLAVATLRKSLGDKSMDVVKASIAALGKAGDRESVPALMKMTGENATRFEAMTALAEMPDARATRFYLSGLTEKSPPLRRASSAALAKISQEAAATLELLASRKELPSTALTELRKIYNRPIPIKKWHIIGPFGKGDNAAIDPSATIDFKRPMVGRKGVELKWQEHVADTDRGMVDLAKRLGSENDLFAFGVAEVNSDADRKAVIALGSDDMLTVWVNGKQVYEFASARGFNPDADTVEVDLKKGSNRVIIRCGNIGGPWQFSVGVSAPAEYAFLKGPAPGAFDPEDFRKKATGEMGDAVRGQKLFADLNGLACVKCHAVGGQGGAVGPDLTGIAAKYTGDEIATSILYPSAKIASGYESVIVATKDGRVITGVVKADTTSGVDLEDAEAKRVRVPLDDIEERRTGDVSIMPNGLAEGLKPKDFADLLAYLATLKEQAKAADAAKTNATGSGK